LHSFDDSYFYNLGNEISNKLKKILNIGENHNLGHIDCWCLEFSNLQLLLFNRFFYRQTNNT